MISSDQAHGTSHEIMILIMIPANDNNIVNLDWNNFKCNHK